MYIKAFVTLYGKKEGLAKLGIEDENAIFGNYPIFIKLSSIDALYPVPDDDGIPMSNVCRVSVHGIEYTITYSYKQLQQKLNIYNEDVT